MPPSAGSPFAIAHVSNRPERRASAKTWRLFQRLQSLAACLLALGGVATSGTAGAVPMLFLDIDGQGQNATVAAFSTFTVGVYASGIASGADGKGMFGFGFEVLFLSAHASAGTATAGVLWTGFVSTSNTSQKVGLTANRFGETSGPSGNGVFLGSFQLTSLSTSDIALTVQHLTGPGDNLLFDGTILDTELVDPFFIDGFVEVPAPATSVMLLPALGMLGMLRGRFRRA